MYYPLECCGFDFRVFASNVYVIDLFLQIWGYVCLRRWQITWSNRCDFLIFKILCVFWVQIHTFLLASLWTFWNPYSVSDNIQKVIKLNTLDLAQQKVWPVLGTNFHTFLKLDSSVKWCEATHFAKEKNRGEITHEVLSFLQICELRVHHSS